jgi:PAS domain S-box-containing protein
MMPNTAVGLLLLGVAAALRSGDAGRIRSWLASLAALLVLLIGLGTIAEYAFGFQFGVDQFFIRIQSEPFPGRPSPPTAVALSCLSAAILMLDCRLAKRIHQEQWLTVTAGIIALTAILGQIFGAGPLYRFTGASTIGVAVPTAVSALLISLGLLLQRPDAGLMRLITAPGPGSVLLLRLLPWAILAPVTTGLIGAHLLERPGITDVPLVFAVLILVTIVVSVFLLSITAAKLNRTHDLLEQQRQDTRSLIDLASDALFVADLSGRYIDVNDAACCMLGYSREELIGKTIMDLILPGDIERLWNTQTRLLEGDRELGEWTLRRKDGSEFPTEISAKILHDGRWQAFVRDISERKLADEALRLSEAKFSGIVSSSQDAIISIDASQKIILFNQGAEKMFGRTSADMIGKPLDVLLPEPVRATHPRHIESFLASPETARGMGGSRTVSGMRSNGENFPIDAAISRISVGGTTFMTAMLRDVTEQARLGKTRQLFSDLGAALAATLEFDELCTAAAQLAVRDLADVCIIDLMDNGKARRAKVVCHERQALVAPALMPMGSSGDNADLTNAIRMCTEPVLIEQLTPTVLEELAFRREPVQVIQATAVNSVITAPLSAHGTVFGRLSLLSSSHSRRLQRQDLHVIGAFAERVALSLESARLYEAARRATRARDEMLGIVAHDLRNPLQLISIHARILARTGTEAIRETAGQISATVQRMSRLIQDLLDVTSLDAGKSALNRQPMDVSELISDSMEAHAPIASSASVLIRSDVPENLPTVLVDRDRILQVFQNLIGNAMKFTSAAGCITLHAERGTGEIVFSVSDTGSGIQPGDLPHVFNRFWQAEKGRGAGLGLAIVKGIVEAHGGHVWARSVPGQGSTFYFTVPLAESACPVSGLPATTDSAAEKECKKSSA